LGHERALIRAIRDAHYDLVINLADQWRAALITRLSAAPVRIGFAFKKRDNVLWRWCHNQLVSTHNHSKLHTVEQNMSALAPLGISSDGARVSMHYSDADQQIVLTRLAEHQVTAPYIVVQPTSRWGFKCWEEESVAATLDQLAQPGRKVVLTAGPDKQELAMINRIRVSTLHQCTWPPHLKRPVLRCLARPSCSTGGHGATIIMSSGLGIMARCPHPIPSTPKQTSVICRPFR
ncbi:MAG: putative lipopolysaccharide heptosyltransferase, partial [Pantoea agglomerans]|nr:putative lipopolysaccharide heptosyltransferase [Pantoea agglomerans]